MAPKVLEESDVSRAEADNEKKSDGEIDFNLPMIVSNVSGWLTPFVAELTMPTSKESTYGETYLIAFLSIVSFDSSSSK
jgi:hypothetical protein